MNPGVIISAGGSSDDEGGTVGIVMNISPDDGTSSVSSALPHLVLTHGKVSCCL